MSEMKVTARDEGDFDKLVEATRGLPFVTVGGPKEKLAFCEQFLAWMRPDRPLDLTVGVLRNPEGEYAIGVVGDFCVFCMEEADAEAVLDICMGASDHANAEMKKQNPDNPNTEVLAQIVMERRKSVVEVIRSGLKQMRDLIAADAAKGAH